MLCREGREGEPGPENQAIVQKLEVEVGGARAERRFWELRSLISYRILCFAFEARKAETEWQRRHPPLLKISGCRQRFRFPTY